MLYLRRTKIGLLVGLATLAGACLPADAARLQQVKVNSAMVGQTAIEFEFDESVSYTDVLKYRPNYLLVNVADSQSDFGKDVVSVNNGAVKDVNIGTSGTDLQLKVGLKDLVPYNIAQNGNSLVVTLGQNGKATAAKANSNAGVATINSINNVDFRKNGNDGVVVIGLDNNSAAVDVSQRSSNSLRVRFNATGVNADQLQTYDVTDFGTPVKSMHVSKQGNTAFVDIAFNGRVDYKTEQKGNQFVVNVSKKKETKKEMPKYNGKPISLNFQDVPVRTVLQLIADFNNFNLVTTDTVRGNKVEELAPLVTEYVQVNYAKASEIAALLVATGDSNKEGNGRILTNRGSVSVDQRTNTLIVKDTAETIDKIQDLVQKLDIPVKQVTIEARIVTIDDTVSEELGVNWSLSKNNMNQHNFPQSSTPTAGNTTLDPYGMKDADNLYWDLNGGTRSDGTSVNNHGHWMSQTAFDVDMYLSALETENKAEVISSPRVTTANQKEALIEQGVDVPTEVSTSSGATSTEWKKAVLSLKVTPQITPDNRIILDLVVTQDTLGEEVSTGNGRERSINTQRVETQVLVENGETIVLGGIYQQELTKRVSKVPLLGDIPYLGALFRYTNDSNRKKELLVFVTPKIVIDKQ